MTEEEILKKLREVGIDPDKKDWGKTKERRSVKSPLVERQKENLQRLSSVLERQIESDQKQVSELHVALMKLKHGGGS